MLGIGAMPAARTGVFIALYTSDPTINNTGTEVSGGSYARKAITLGAEADGTVANSNALSWAGMPTCTVTHFAIFDALTGGNPIMYDSLPVPAQFVSGDPYSIAAGNLILSEL